MSICEKTGKARYSRQGATDAVNSLRKRQMRYPVYKYQCKVCNDWHLATEIKTEAQKRWHFKNCS